MNMLLDSLPDQDKTQLKKLIPEELHRIFESEFERCTSFHVLYGLLQFTLDREDHPISGWGNLVRGKDVGIGDDVERLHRIQTIVRGISYPENIPVDSCLRLLHIMTKALTRLDRDAQFEKHLKTLDREITLHKLIHNIKLC